jgi:hypothetical protein
MSSQTLTFKGRRGSMYNLYTQFLPASPSLTIIVYIYIYGFEMLLNASAYVKETIKTLIYDLDDRIPIM